MLVKRELHNDLQKELRVTTSSLIPTAHLFQPSGTAAGCAKTRQLGGMMAARGVIPNQQRLAPFEGKVSWDTYHTQFEFEFWSVQTPHQTMSTSKEYW